MNKISRTAESTRLMIDGHVHIYDCYDPSRFFRTANAYLDHYYDTLYANGIPHAKLLLLTEAKNNDFFSRWKAEGGFENDLGYSFSTTEEEESLRLDKEGKPQCYVIRGRQVITREKLEILAIGSDNSIPDGLPARQVLDTLIERRQLAILAWGVGKWMFSRGRVIQDLIRAYHSRYVFTGDNSGRPVFWPRPSQFKFAETLQVAMLNGSDPLPFEDETGKPGSFGSTVEGTFVSGKPYLSLNEIMVTPGVQRRLETFGRRDGVAGFFKRQSRIYFKKYLKKYLNH